MPTAKDIPVSPGVPSNRLPGRVTREYVVQIVTPMYGGGVIPGTTDGCITVRETAVRGHLRHWWRLIIGNRLGAAMRQREEEIFGSIEFPSPLALRVIEQPRPLQLGAPQYGRRHCPSAYAFFSAIDSQHQVAREGLRFRLSLSWDGPAALRVRRKAQNIQRERQKRPRLPDSIEDIGDDIGSSLQAWLALGGLGARTRRGCGAVHCQELAGNLPELPAKVLVGTPRTNAVDAWLGAVGVYRDFRQTPRGEWHQKTLRSGRTVNVPGRSHWPEADSIRQITGCALKQSSGSILHEVPPDQNTNDHSTPVVRKGLLPAFPRAALGLPIVFHFIDGPDKRNPGQADLDPKDVQLVPVICDTRGVCTYGNRWASPVVTRPLWLDGSWCPAVIVLDQPIPASLRGVSLRGKGARAGGADLCDNLSLDRVFSASFGELRPLRGRASALEALVEFLVKECHFREVAAT